MKLAWMFGNSLEAHHLLYAYLLVWIIQGGYCTWIVWQWFSLKPESRVEVQPSSKSRIGF